MSLIAELKRRNVFKVGMAWLALGWVIVQVTATMAPFMRLPDWIVPVVAWIGVIGFPCVLIFSWVYELTPEGLKRESEIDRSGSITHVTGKRLDYTIIALLVAAIGMFALDRFSPREPTVGAGLPANPSEPAEFAAKAAPTETEDRAQGALPQPQPQPAPTATAADPKSIAVLPFVNMSSDKEQEYFSDGLSEELLNLLARIPELRVTSRSSAFAFKGKEIEIPEVARRLNVAHILEGSVRKSGEQVRITAQLIDTRSDTHLWSQSWDRKLDDIFAVQDEIAAAVAAQMKISLLGEVPKTAKADPAAFALLLQARELRRQGTPQSLERALALAQQALEIDPHYAAAWTALSAAYQSQAGIGLRPMNEGFRLAREASNRALAIDPDNAQTHAQLSRLAMGYDFDLATAARHIERALALAPADPDIVANAAALAKNLARVEISIPLYDFVLARDPVNSSAYNNQGLNHVTAGQFDQAIAEFHTALELSPGRLGTNYNIAEALLHKGDPQAALAALEQEKLETWRLIGTAMVQHSLGDSAASDAALQELEKAGAESWAYNIAFVHTWRREPDLAFEWLEKAVLYRDSGLSEIAGERLFDNIRQDPRWLPFVRRLGMAPEQLAAIPFEVKLPAEVARAEANR